MTSFCVSLNCYILGNGTMEKLQKVFTASGQPYGHLTLDLHCNRFGPTALFQVWYQLQPFWPLHVCVLPIVPFLTLIIVKWRFWIWGSFIKDISKNWIRIWIYWGKHLILLVMFAERKLNYQVLNDKSLKYQLISPALPPEKAISIVFKSESMFKESLSLFAWLGCHSQFAKY